VNKSVIFEEILKCSIPDRIRLDGSPLEHDLLHIIIEDLRGIAAEVTECIQMALNQGVDIYLECEFSVSHRE
jgi:hypothetical protein